MAISKKMYSFDDKVFLDCSDNTYAVTFCDAKYTTKNPKRAIEIFSNTVREYLNLKMTAYLAVEGRNIKTGCKQNMSCELCLMNGKYENQDCYKNNPEQFYKMFNKPGDEQKQSLTAEEINKIRYKEAVNKDEYSGQRVGIVVSNG